MLRVSRQCSSLRPVSQIHRPVFSLCPVPKRQILLTSAVQSASTNESDTVCVILDKTHVSLPESQRSIDAESNWSTWMAAELRSKLVGLTAGTVRAQVRIVGVRSAEVRKGVIRAEQVDLVLDLEGVHSKEAGCKMKGVVRVVLKTEDNKDQLCITDAIWDPDHSSLLSKQVQSDIMVAAETPLEGALAARLNDLLWDVERRSMDE